ncbi:MAG: hypothetical protein II949_03180 [Prevotella sp.]|nr:hypothetical protein [Prevotella sp.]
MRHITAILLVVAALAAACTGGSRRAEIEARKAALKHKQDSTLLASQQELAQVDSLLEVAKAEHDALHQWVMKNATRLNDQSPEVVRLNRLRAHRDSLQVQWETLGAKIKYIRKVKGETPPSLPEEEEKVESETPPSLPEGEEKVESEK